MLNKILELGISLSEAKELLKVSKDIDKDYNMLLEGYPIQYLIGYVNFYGYKIIIDKNVLIPRYETELLVEKTLKYMNNFDSPRILDIGTGSGCISIALLKNKKCLIDAMDISDEALEIAKYNSKINNVEINFIKSDLFSNINKVYDVIISNPPYISYDEDIMESVKRYEPNIALYSKDNGLYFYKTILDNSKEHLKSKFLIAFEIGYWQANAIKEYSENVYPNATITIEKDYSLKDRYVFIKNE